MKQLIIILNRGGYCMLKNSSKAIALIAAISFLQSPVFAQENKKAGHAQTTAPAPPRSVTIHQEVDFKVSPQRVYEALLDSKQFSDFTVLSGEFSAKSAQVDPAAGGAFSLFDGHIIGRNIELVPNQRIVQAWRVVDWPAGVYSIVKFELKAQGQGTRLVFDHTGFPENLQKTLAAGWQSHYWELLTKYFR